MTPAMLYSIAMSDYLSPDTTERERSDEEVLVTSLTHPSLFALLVRKYEAPFLRKAQKKIRNKFRLFLKVHTL